MAAVIEDTATNFGRAVVMPNLNPPILTVEDALSYKQRLLNAIDLLITNNRQSSGLAKNLDTLRRFKPLMTVYLSESISFEELKKISETEDIVALK